MSKQLFLLSFMCCAFQASNTMNKPIDNQKSGSRFAEWMNYCFDKSQQQQKEFLQGYYSHLQQVPVEHGTPVSNQKKDIATPK